MSVRFQPARIPAGDAVNVQNYVPAAAAEVVRGDIGQLDANGELIMHTLAAQTNVIGVTLEHTTAAGESANPSGEIAVAKADRNMVFAGPTSNDGTVIGPGDAAWDGIDIGDEYGLERIDDIPHVNVDEETDVFVVVVDKSEELGLIFFKFLESTLQQP